VVKSGIPSRGPTVGVAAPPEKRASRRAIEPVVSQAIIVKHLREQTAQKSVVSTKLHRVLALNISQCIQGLICALTWVRVMSTV
jgi:hypothetical protein